MNSFFVAALVVLFSLSGAFFAVAQTTFNPEINYQAKLLDNTASPVADGAYDVEFNLYTAATGGTAVWTETQTVNVVSGLFSVMLGSSTSLTGVDFNQTLYLGVTVEADAEMTPRKVLGAVPAAFEAQNAETFAGIATTSFLRSDMADTASALLTFTGGLVSNSSSTITRLTTLTATTTNLVVNGERFTDLTGTGLTRTGTTLSVDVASLDLLYASTTDFDTSAELLAILTDETGTGSAVFSASPTFTGTVNAAALTLSSTFTLSGTAANIALGSNWLTGDGQDEGVYVTSAGSVGVGTTTPGQLFSVAGTFGVATGTRPAFMVNPQTGRVAIGTTTAVTTERLTVSGGSIAVTEGGMRVVGQEDALADSLSSHVVEDGIVYALSNNPSTDVHIVDATNPADPRIVLEKGGPITGDVVKVGNYLYAFNGGATNNSEVIDVTNPAVPVTARTFSVGQVSREAVTDGNYIYVTTDTASESVYVFDITTRTNPIKVATINAGALVNDLAVYQNKLYLALASTTAALRIYNVASPTAISLLSTESATTSPASIAVTADRVYLGASSVGGNKEIYAYQTTNVANPVPLTSIDSTSVISDLAIVNNTLYVLGNTVRALVAYDIASSTRILELGRVSLGASTVYELAIEGQYAYIGGQTGTQALAVVKLGGIEAPTIQTGSLYVDNFRSMQGVFSANLNVGGRAAFGQDISVARRIDVGTSLAIGTTSTSSNALTVAGSMRLTGGLYDRLNSIGTNGRILKTTGSGVEWVATSTLGFLASSSNSVRPNNVQTAGQSDELCLTYESTGATFEWQSCASGSLTVADIDTSAELAAIMTDETGTGRYVLSNSPAFSGTATFSALSASSTVTFSALTAGAPLALNSSNQLVSTTSISASYLAANVILSTEIDTSSELLGILGDETGTNRLVFSNSPAFSGTATFSALSASSTLSLTGSAANIALGSNWLSGDGDDEGVYVAGTGNVGIGTSTPAQTLSVAGSMRLTGALYDRLNSAGTNGYVLKSNGSATEWVATSTLGLSGNPFGASIGPTELQATDFGDYTCNGTTCSLDADTVSDSELDYSTVTIADFTNDSGYLTDITGESFLDLTDTPSSFTANRILYTNGAGTALVDAANFTFNGTTFNAPTTTLSGLLSLSGSAANIALGSNWLSGDGGDEGIYVGSTGNVGIGTSTPNQALSIFRSTADAAIEFSAASGASTKWAIGIDYSDSRKFKISSSSVLGTNDRFVIDGAGRVGIGTSTPDTLLTLAGGGISATRPTSPVTTGTYNTTGDAEAVTVVGRVAYVADGPSGLQVIDVSRPASPALLSTYNTSGDAKDVVVNGRIAYVADSSSGLQILDVSNLNNPVLLGTYSSVSNVENVFVVGRYAYITDGVNGVRILDVIDPANPTLVATYDTLFAYDVSVSGRYAYVADGTTGVLILDVSNPASPTLVGTYNSSGSAYGVTVVDRYLYVADNSDGLDIVDIETPSAPSIVGTYNTAGAAYEVVVAGRIAYIADFSGGVDIVDVSVPAAPYLLANYNSAGLGMSVAVAGRYIYVADEGSGLQIVDANGSEISGLAAGSVDATDVYVQNNLIVGMNSNLRGALAVGEDVLVGGAMVIRGTASSSALSSNTRAALTIESGYVGIGTTTPTQALTVAGGFRLTGAFRDANNSAGTNGYVLQSTGTGVQWVATSTLGLGGGGGLASGDIDTSAELAAIMTDETGTAGSVVFSASPTFTGTATFVGSTFTSATSTQLTISSLTLGRIPYATTAGRLVDSSLLTFTGTAFSAPTTTLAGLVSLSGSNANIAVGSNYVSGDGGDEGLTVDSTGMVTLTRLSGAVSVGLNIHNPSTALSSGTQIEFDAGSSVTQGAITQVIMGGSGTDSDMYFSTRGSAAVAERMRITSTGRIGIGTTTPNQALTIFRSAADAAIEFSTVSGSAEKWTIGIDDSDGAKFKISSSSALGTNDRFVIDGVGYVGIGTSTPTQALTVQGGFRLTGAFRDRNNSAGTNGYVLQSTGTGVQWVATSTLGLGGSGGGLAAGDIDTSAELAAIMTDETGTGRYVLSNSPAFSGTATFSALTATSTLTLSGTVANIALGSNWLSGDGGDEGVFVSSAGNVGIGTTTQLGGARLSVDGDIAVPIARAFKIDNQEVLKLSTGPFFGVSNMFLGSSVSTIDTGSAFGNFGAGIGTLDALTGGYDNVAVGYLALTANTSGQGNTAVGAYALSAATDDVVSVTAVGAYAANELRSSSGFGSSFFGYNAGAQLATSSNSVVVGNRAAYGSGGVYEANGLTVIGTYAGYNLETGADNNILVGNRAGEALTTGASNIVIGYDIDLQNNTWSNRLNIGNLIFGTGLDGTGTTLASGNIGIGTTSPMSKFTVAGDARITGSLRDSSGDAGTNGFVLLSTGTGTNWVATSSLGITGGGGLTSANIDTSSELAAIMTDETGTGRFVLSNSPAFSGTATFSALSATSTFTLSGTAANIALGSNYLSGDGDDEGIFIASSGNVGIGTTTPAARLALQRTALSGSGTAGFDRYYGFTNSVAGAIQYGEKAYLKVQSTATTTLVGSILRLEDSTGLLNTIRGFEVQAQRGTSTIGENTAISGFGRTFGVRGTTEGDAGGVFEPAGIFAQTRGTTQGNALRAYSSSITTATLVSLFHDTSAFAGTGLEMNFGNTSGSFSSTTASRFIDLQNAGTSKFIVYQSGVTTIVGTTTLGAGGTSQRASLHVGFGGICVDNDGSCNAGTAGRMTSVSTATGNSDLAEMYFSSQALRTGELVVSDGFLSVRRATGNPDERVLGVVSTKPGLLLGFDDESLISGQQGYPLALSGRVPVRLSNENGAIAVGDALTLSSIPGVAMKAVGSAKIVGYALEAFDGTYAYTAGYIDQFGDDIKPPTEDATVINTDARINDGCSFGGGGATGAADEFCTPVYSAPLTPEETTTQALTAYEREQRALEALRTTPAESYTVDGEAVKVGQVTMFVDSGYYLLAQQSDILNELVSTSTELVLGAEEGSGETLWDRMKTLAQGFVDGVLSVAGLKADKVETSELCVDGVCINADDLRALLQAADQPVRTNPSSDSGTDASDTNETPAQEPEVTDGAGESTGGDAASEPDGTEPTPDESPLPAAETVVEPAVEVSPETDEPSPEESVSGNTSEETVPAQ